MDEQPKEEASLTTKRAANASPLLTSIEGSFKVFTTIKLPRWSLRVAVATAKEE